jgi:hypothetical protein
MAITTDEGVATDLLERPGAEILAEGAETLPPPVSYPLPDPCS